MCDLQERIEKIINELENPICPKWKNDFCFVEMDEGEECSDGKGNRPYPHLNLYKCHIYPELSIETKAQIEILKSVIIEKHGGLQCQK